MSKEEIKLALGKIKSARDCHPNAVNTLLFEAEEILEEALAKPDFWEGYVPEPVKPAQQEPKIDIYRSFEQWKSGNVLEHGVPRTEHYSEAQLDLVEMGWNYGYDAGRAVEQALDKKAENARELGLDYEPVCNKDPQGCWNVRCQLGKKCKNTPAQQEPVACECHRCIDEKGLNVNGLPLSMTKMILCPECGNKRCPKASDHRLACTNSNEPGQPGSIYTSPPAQQEPVAHAVIAGALFDFMGWLTSRKERLVLSSADNASPAVEAITEFAKMRGLSLNDAKVQDWNTSPPAQHHSKAWPPSHWTDYERSIAAAEREACAQTVEGFYGSRDEYAAAIRARSNT
jgi:hypothetical protein